MPMSPSRPPPLLTHWALIGAGVVANGALGEKLVRPRTGEYAAHVYKSAAAVAWVLAVSRLYATRSRASVRQAWEAGAAWLALSVAFEFLAGHYVFRTPWERLTADYRLRRGRLWPVVLLALLVGPPMAAADLRRRCRR